MDILTLAVMGHEEPANFAPPGLTPHQLKIESERTTDQYGAMYLDLGGES